MRRRLPISVALAVVIASGMGGPRAGEGDLPEEEISLLREKLAEIDELDSTSQQRRGYKRVVRTAAKLIEQYPESSGRFDLLGITFEAQRALMVADDSRANARRFVEICQALAKAPNEYAALRLPADLVLTGIEIDRAGDDKAAVAAAITSVIERYRKTPSEVDCLMAAIELTIANGCKELYQKSKSELIARFSLEPKVIDYLAKRFNLSGVAKPSPFRGTFKRADGAAMEFPKEQLGQVYMVCYWSEKSDFLDEKFRKVKELQDKSGAKVFSINVDGLPDHGQARLTRMGLNWIALQLPEEQKNEIDLVHERPLYTAVDEQGLGIRFSFRAPTGRHHPGRLRPECLQAYMILKYWEGALQELNLLCGRRRGFGHATVKAGLAKDYTKRAKVNEKLGRTEAAAKDRQTARDLLTQAIPGLERWAAGAHKNGLPDKAKRIRAWIKDLQQLVRKLDEQLKKN